MLKQQINGFDFRAKYTNIFAGFVAVILLIASNAMAQEVMWRYTVRPGDNLITLGEKHLINPDSWKIMQSINQIKNPYRIPVGTVLQVPIILVKQIPASAEVILASGQVLIQRSATDFEPINVGDKLGPGTKIVTKEFSKVIIQFADLSTVELGSNAKMQLDSMSLYSGGAMVDTKVRLQKGQIKTHANPQHEKGNSMQVITPSAIAAVRGTQFRVSAEDSTTTQETLEGKVGLEAANQEVVVNMGFGSKAEQGKPPKPPVKLLPAADTSQMKAFFNQLPVIFDIPQLNGAVAWVGEIASDKQFSSVVTESKSSTQQLDFGDLPDGQYFLTFRAQDQFGISGYDALHSFTLNAKPNQPIMLEPELKALIRDARPILRWRQVDAAEKYKLELASDLAFNQIVVQKILNGNQYQLEQALKPGSYYWRVSSISKDNKGLDDYGPAIEHKEFTYKPLPNKPDISQFIIKSFNNSIQIQTVPPPDGLSYVFTLDNPVNDQKNVWQETGTELVYQFLLKEYGPQTLYIQYQDRTGALGPAAIYEFYAEPEW
jgi:hypothetical protein